MIAGLALGPQIGPPPQKKKKKNMDRRPASRDNNSCTRLPRRLRYACIYHLGIACWGAHVTSGRCMMARLPPKHDTNRHFSTKRYPVSYTHSLSAVCVCCCKQHSSTSEPATVIDMLIDLLQQHGYIALKVCTSVLSFIHLSLFSTNSAFQQTN